MTTVYIEPGYHRLLMEQVTAMSDPFLPYLYSACFISHAVEPSHLLPLYGSQDLSPLLHIPEFQKPDALPGPCSKLPVRYWYAHARTNQRRFNMCLYNRPISLLASLNTIGFKYTGMSSLPSASCL